MTSRRTYRKQAITRLILVTGIIVAFNFLSSAFFSRIDLTADKRFTLTDSTKVLLRDLPDIVFVKVYLKGDFPAGFERLSSSVKEMLDEFKVYGKERVQYEFLDPAEGKTETEIAALMKELAEKGLQPTNVQNRAGDEYSQQIVVPGALVYFKGKEAPVNFLENTPGTGAQTALNNSIAQLEYKLNKAIRELTFQAAKIAFLTGHGEIQDYRLAGLFDAITSFYEWQFLDLESTTAIPPNVKCLIVAKPTQPFSEKDKFKIDQYIMNGGKVLWMVETLNAEIDSVMKKHSFLSMDYPLNVEDQFFRYGFRINPVLLMDLQCNPVPLVVSTQGAQPEMARYPCFYFPVFTAKNDHPVVKGIDAVASKFASTIDTLKADGVNHTILLQSSQNSRMVFTPWMVDFSELRNRPNLSDYNQKNLAAAVLLEGSFTSIYKNRVPPEFESVLKDSLKIPFRESSIPTKMITIADADIAVNEFSADGQPLPLGFYRYTNEYFSNKNFLLNCIDYLSGFPQLIDTRSKTVQLRLLDEVRVKESRLTWQLVNLLLPLTVLLIFGAVFSFIRMKKYGTINPVTKKKAA